MYISSNHSYKPNFGYDKKLNEELKTELANYPDKKWASALSSLNTYCNKIEGNIVSESKDSKKSDSRIQDYLDIFLSVKQALAGFVSITFEHLNYADREFKHYDDEYVKNGSKDNDWRKEACDVLKDWVSPDLLKKNDKPKEIFVPKFDEDGREIIDESNTQNSNPSPDSAASSIINGIVQSQLSTKSFLQEFKPDEYSPKGFSDVAGMSDLKRDLNEGIIEYVQNPEQAKIDFEEYGKTIPRAILLYGPPGCGKTYITQALASEVDVPLYLLNISKAGSHYINMTSKNIKTAFDEAITIADKSQKPCILFMDEIDSLAFDRSSRMEPDDLKQVATMLQAIDTSKKSNVIIIGATNKFNLLDPAIRRRFDSKFFIDVPDTESIKALIIKNLSPLKKGQKLLDSYSDIEYIAEKLHGYSNSSISNISKQAALNAMRRGRADISVEDYENAIKTTTEEMPDRKLYMPDSSISNKRIGFCK